MDKNSKDSLLEGVGAKEDLHTNCNYSGASSNSQTHSQKSQKFRKQATERLNKVAKYDVLPDEDKAQIPQEEFVLYPERWF